MAIRIRIEELERQLDSDGNFVRYNYVEFYTQTVPQLNIQAIVAVVNGLPIPENKEVIRG